MSRIVTVHAAFAASIARIFAIVSFAGSCALRWALLAVTVVLALAGRDALGNVPHNEDTPAGLFEILAFFVVPGADVAWQDTGYLRQAGVEPQTTKARIAEAWFDRLRADPAVAIAVPGGMEGLEARLRDEPTRERLIKSGIARLAPDDRLAYFMLLTKYIDKAARGNCQGAASMQEIVDRVSVGSMSDADAAEYFALLYRIVIRSLLAAPIALPTPAQQQKALRHLDDAVNAELAGDPLAVARMTRVTRSAPDATTADVCWASAILMRSVASMEVPDREALLLYMLDVDEPVQTQAPDAAHEH